MSCSRRWNRCWPKARWRFRSSRFPFQFEGVAFLYPRHAAILADEMGLGKTMQAITAIRLLLHRGEVQTVLLVCPKPLVTNWQREFAVWAPEMPVMVIEGDQAKRRWQWQLPDVPVRIANYEFYCAIENCWPNAAFRSGRARRVATHQEPLEFDQRSRPFNRPQTQLGPDRHAGRKQRRRPAWAFSSSSPRASFRPR